MIDFNHEPSTGYFLEKTWQNLTPLIKNIVGRSYNKQNFATHQIYLQNVGGKK